MLELPMTKTRPKNYHHGDLREALIKAGRLILEEQGIAALTLRACARKAGVSHAAPQHHFATVAELLAEIAASGFEDFVAALDKGSANAPGPRERLKAMGRSYIAFAHANTAIYKLMFAAEVPLKSERLQFSMKAAWNQLVVAVAAVHGSENVEATAARVWSLVHGFSMLTTTRRLPPTVDQDDALEALLQQLD